MNINIEITRSQIARFHVICHRRGNKKPIQVDLFGAANVMALLWDWIADELSELDLMKDAET